jgi:hypothetical protein
MKRVFYFLTAILVTSVTFLTSCTEDTTTPDQPPTIEFVAGSGFINENVTLTVGTTFQIKVLMEANATSGSKIQDLKVTRVFDLQTSDTTYAINETTATVTIGFVAQATAGVERITFEAIDKAGQNASIYLDITTEAATTPIHTFTMKILGSYQSTYGSSFASIDGTVYSMNDAFNNQAAIDFLYWWGASTSATIGAPDDVNANVVYTGATGLPNWTIKNATRFKTSALTAAEFDAITDGNVLATNASGADQTRIGTLAVGNVFAFVSVNGKNGLIKVDNITTGAAGDITIDVKVQE